MMCSSITLTCQADRAIFYVWEKLSGSIPTNAIGVNTDNITLINVQQEDSGNYRCVAANTCESSYSEYATVNITSGKIVKFNMIFIITIHMKCA